MASQDDYDMLSDIDHVLQRPDTYIGSIEVIREPRWILDNNKMKQKLVKYNPGLEQCVMELITNATDRAQVPENGVTKIDISIEGDVIKVTNNGTGILIEISEKHGIYIPEMIFGNMRSSTNFKKDVKRTVGGKNGIGAKAANIFSKTFKVTTVCNGKKYVQTFSDNMKSKTKPKVTNVKSADFTTIEYEPDLKAFGMKSLSENDTPVLIQKRSIDASAVTNKNVSVTFNKTKVSVKDFESYMNLYVGNKKDCPRVYTEISDRWAIGFALNPFPSSMHVSFVNGICTEDGGTHVNHVLDPVITRVTKELQDKNPDITIRKQYIKDNIFIFVKSLIENPTFTSQTKRQHTTRSVNFGSRVIISDETIKKIVKLGITKGILEIAKAKDHNGLKKADGKKKVRISDIPKLDDANHAGGVNSHLCTLILTEGDSAKATAIAGLSVVGRDRYGVFPLKGKLLNVSGASDSVIAKNEEIVNINKIMGLAQGEQDKKKIRYGKIMLLCDQDSDGHHIKGLLFNYISTYWPNLFADNFIESLLTPIVKVFKGNQGKSFYNTEDYDNWKNVTLGSSGWRVKYYKGLGTSTAKEAKEYFSDLTKNKISYKFNPNENSDDMNSLKLAFAKNSKSKTKDSDRRKEWITRSLEIVEKCRNDGVPLVDYNKKSVSISNFVNRELVQFSIYDNQRSIPHVMDGLKPSQRKILFSCLKRNLFLKENGSGEIKVAQLSGYVSEHSGYHHGEVSLQGAIVKMAQDFVGSNNMNILYPSGQFGTRLKGGDDASSSRYIFTYVNDWVKDVFNKDDNKLLNYLEDDGFSVEPDYYVPTIPIILVNGTEGIGTGWSTSIPCFNPRDIISNLKKLIHNEECEMDAMDPWYRGFKGTITKNTSKSWIVKGVYKRLKETRNYQEVEVTELPVGLWTSKFKEKLAILEERDDIVAYNDESNDTEVKYQIKFKKNTLEDMEDEDVETLLGLTKKISTTNMTLFGLDGTIKRYNCAEEILWDFYLCRKKFYVKRRNYIVETLENKLRSFTEKMRFIRMVMDDQIVVFRRKKIDISEDLETHEFQKIENSYNYLLDIKIHAFTQDKLTELQKQIDGVTSELGIVKSKTSQDLWLEDLGQIKSSRLT